MKEEQPKNSMVTAKQSSDIANALYERIVSLSAVLEKASCDQLIVLW